MPSTTNSCIFPIKPFGNTIGRDQYLGSITASHPVTSTPASLPSLTMYNPVYHVCSWITSVGVAMTYWSWSGYAEATNMTRTIVFCLASLYFFVCLGLGPVRMFTESLVFQLLNTLCRLTLAYSSATLAKDFLRRQCLGKVGNDPWAIGIIHVLLSFTVITVTDCIGCNVSKTALATPGIEIKSN